MEANIQPIIDEAGSLRDSLKNEESNLRAYVETIKSAPEKEGFNKGECIAQAMIALRAVEEARMRVGKVIQYAAGGVSSFDKK
jgi:hypothetical protein